MKQKYYTILLTLVISTFFLTSCGSGISATSWPGIATDGETIFVSGGSKIYAISLNNTLKWSFPAEADNTKAFWAEPVIDKNQLIVGDYTKTLYNIDANTGKENWIFDGASGRYIAGALIVGNTILAPSTDFSLYALNFNKNQVWKPVLTKGALWVQPVSDEKTAYFPSMDHNLYAVNLENGVVGWAVPLGAAVLSKPTLDKGGYLYLSTVGSEVLKIQTSDGKIVNRFPVSKVGWSSPVINNDFVYFGDQSGTIYALNANNFSLLWKKDTGAPIIGSACITTKGLVWITQNNEVLAFDFDGNKLWSKTLTGSLYTSPIVVKDLIFIAITGGDSLVVALDVNGAEKWSFSIPK